jgi:hypothetical protein
MVSVGRVCPGSGVAVKVTVSPETCGLLMVMAASLSALMTALGGSELCGVPPLGLTVGPVGECEHLGFYSGQGECVLTVGGFLELTLLGLYYHQPVGRFLTVVVVADSYRHQHTNAEDNQHN